MNVLTNLMAMLTPKTAKDTAQTSAAGQAGGADFAALMEMPTPDAAIAVTPGTVAPAVPAALPIIGDGADEAAPDTDVASALPLPQQTAAVLAQQVALPVAGAKAIRNATVSADPKPAGGKALPVVDGDAAGNEGTAKGDTEGEGDAMVALPVPGAAADVQAAAIMTSAVIPASTPASAPTPAPLPRQDRDGAPVEGVATVAGVADRASPSNGSVNIADINKDIKASGAVSTAAAMPSPAAQPAMEALAAADPKVVDPKAAGKTVAADIAQRGRDGKAKTGTESSGAASPLPSPVSQSLAVAEDVMPVAMPSRLAGRVSVTAARAEAPNMPVTPSAAPVQPAAPVAAETAAAIPQAIVQAVGGQPATVVAQAAAQGVPATAAPSAETDAPVIGEATALLRMAAGVPVGKRAAPPAIPAYDTPKVSAKAETMPQTAEARVTDLSANADRPAQPVHAMQASLASAFPAIPAGTQPVTDLSATLGQQVIDMSSGGQWIDGLAKEIATLASGTGQGSFRLSPEHLGPMRVDIRHGDLGAEISLTVQTAAAETALRQDSDKLKADAQLSAVRVHEVRVERVHTVAETARSDGTGNQNNGNNNGASSWNQGGTQTAFSQSQGQSNGSAQANAQGQGNGQQGGRKVSGGDAVLNHAGPSDQRVDDAQDGVRRARYA